jgi:hypothetical protein
MGSWLHNFFHLDTGIVALVFELSCPLPTDITNKDELETLKNKIRMREERTPGVDRPNLTSDILVIGMDGTPRPDSAIPLGGEVERGAWSTIC